MQSDWQPEYKYLWPNRTQELLLHAATAGGEASSRAFSEWKLATGFANYADIDFPSMRVIPMVYRRLVHAELDDPWLRQMRGLHRYTWATNKRKRATLRNVTESLQDEGVACMALKGSALLLDEYYDDAGERPMNDVDIMVAPDAQSRAEEVLTRLGWTKRVFPWPAHAEQHASAWAGPHEVDIDLHIKLLPPPFPFCGVRHMSHYGHSVDVSGVAVSVPSPTDLLLHVLTHGRLYWSIGPIPFAWVTDALRILQRAQSDIDWDRMLHDSHRSATLFPVRETLGYLRHKHQAPVPDDILQRLQAVQLTRTDLIPFARWTGQLQRHKSVLDSIDDLWADFVCREQLLERRPRMARFPVYLAQRCHRAVRIGRAYKQIKALLRRRRAGGLFHAVEREPLLQPPIIRCQPEPVHPPTREAA